MVMLGTSSIKKDLSWPKLNAVVDCVRLFLVG